MVLFNNIKDFLKIPRRIFILEDDEDRISWFKKALSSHTLTICQTADAAIQSLSPDFEMIFLDHDLDLEHMDALFDMMDDEAKYTMWLQGEKSCPQTGYDVACHIAAQDSLKHIPVIIHSMNPAGSKLMLDALPEANRIQFPLLKGFL